MISNNFTGKHSLRYQQNSTSEKLIYIQKDETVLHVFVSLQCVVSAAEGVQHENNLTPYCDILKAPVNKLPNVPELLHQRNKGRGGGG